MKGFEVRPAKWTNVIDLYDDGCYSAIWGHYDGNSDRCLGVRWNGENRSCGFPSQGKHPLWYIEPEIFTVGLLFQMYEKVSAHPETGCIENLKTALSEVIGR